MCYLSVAGNLKQISWNHDGSCLASVSDRAKDVKLKVVKGYSAMDLSVINAMVRKHYIYLRIHNPKIPLIKKASFHYST